MTPPRWNLLPSAKLSQLTLHEQYFAFSGAYLDSAEKLCRILARSTKTATFERGAVVLYLTQHALELFYKGAILRKAPTEKYSHGLDQLQRRYKILYPAKRFSIRKLFGASYEGLTEEQIAQVQGLEPPIDQLYRYPEDKQGKPWNALLAFEAASFTRELAVLREEFINARRQIEAIPSINTDTPLKSRRSCGYARRYTARK